jgi:UDP:flavonoid glycosyltransferase YjiC (YdhE family)
MAAGFLLVILAVFVPALSTGSRILMIPCVHKSHVNMFSVTGKALKDAGHSVDVLVEETRKSMVEKVGVRAIAYSAVPESQLMLSDSFVEDMLKTHNVLQMFAEMTKNTMIMVEGIVQSTTLMSELENGHYDIALIDGVDFARALYVIPYAVGIRYITLTARHDPWNAGLPQLPSVEHLPGIGSAITVNSTFLERIQSIIKTSMIYLNMPPPVLDDKLISRFAPTRPKATFAELFKNSEMWLCNLDTICLDWPHVHGNHYQFVTGLSLEQPKALPAELEEFVQGSKAGVIVLTFGSALKDIPADMLEKMLVAFAQIEQRVIMRHSGAVPGKVPANVKMLSWLPQGDLLGHPKTKAFITHGGTNGQLEALYHAVPMITVPMFGDQPYNADRVTRKGFGVTLNKDTFTSDDVLLAIKKVVKEKQIQQNIRKCSEKFRSLPSAHDTILFWVEHVIRFGGDHLKPVAIHVPLWKMFMLDVLALVLIVILILYTILLFVCIWLCKKCSKPRAELPLKKRL